jgi:HSP20 family protein
MLEAMNWDPLHELVALQERSRQPIPPDAAWTPSVDMLETRDAFVIVVELPGARAEHLSITATQDGVVLSGERPAPAPPPQRFLRVERGYGRFSRAFNFAEPVDVNAIGAKFERGLLTITVPKAYPASEHRINIG